MLLHDFLTGRTAKYTMSGEHAKEYSTQRINIRVRSGRLSQQLLWRGSTGCAIAIEQIPLRFWSAQFKHTHDAEVCHKQVTIGFDENAIACKAAMEHRLLVRILQRSGYLIQVTAGLVYIYRAFLHKHCTQ